jgi:CDP-glycerol glycerophosphotransferase
MSIFERKLPVDKMIVTGLPGNDKLVNFSQQPFISKMKKIFSNPIIVFYVPTFRLSQYKGTPFDPFKGFLFNQVEFGKFLDEENIVFLYKPHPFDKSLPNFSCSERFFFLKKEEYNEEDDLYNLLGNVDILATDYSSVYFDFLLTEKPIILMPFDYNEYIKIRGLYFDYNEYMLGIKAYNWVDFIRIIKRHEYYSISDKFFNYYHDGNSCERVFNSICELK